MQSLRSLVITSLFAAIFLSACNVKVDSPKVELPSVTTGGDNSPGIIVTCSAALASSQNGVAHPDEPTLINVTGNGGVAPYYLENSTTGFGNTTSLTRIYANPTSSNRVIQDTVTIRDSLGLTAACSFTVTILPHGTPSDLACNMTVSPASPSVGSNATFTVTASGGTGSYTFQSFAPGTNGTVVQALTPISATQATAIASYSTSGSKVATAIVKDSSNETVSCNVPLTVTDQASLTVTSSPVSSTPVNSSFTLTAIASGFSGTPTYSFVPSDNRVIVNQSGNVAVLTTTSSTGFSFSVSVSASSAGVTRTTSVNLSFTSSTPSSIVCSLELQTAFPTVNSSTQFVAKAANGDTLIVDTFDPGVNSTGNINNLTATYSTAGYRTALVTAHSANRNATCFSGQKFGITFYVYPMLSCSVDISTNYVRVNEWFYAQARVTPGTAIGSVQLTNVSSSGTGFNLYWPVPSVAPYIYYSSTGSKPLNLTIKDSANRMATCSTTVLVNP